MNPDNYLKLLMDVLWPSIQEEAESEGYSYQQDGAPLHCARKCLDFVLDTSNRVISRRADIPWPACSPDLSPLDYWFWGELQEIVREKNPESLEDVIEIVTEAAASMESLKVIRATQNFRRRVELCRKKKGAISRPRSKFQK